METTRLTKRERRQQRADGVRRVATDLRLAELTPEALVARLADADPLIATAATETLIARGHEAVPALVAGLRHPDGKRRATCALLLDHVADSRAVRPLIEVIRHDPLETVRRCALHSLVCDGCKECPLPADVVAALIEVMSCDRSLAVRRRAVFYLGHGRPDPRVVPALEGILAREQDPVLLQRARVALARHSAPPAGDAERCAVVSTV